MEVNKKKIFEPFKAKKFYEITTKIFARIRLRLEGDIQIFE